MTDLGTLGGPSSHVTSINESGQVIGVSETAAGNHHAFFWDKGVLTDLGTLGGSASLAYDINNSGQVVGWSDTASTAQHAFLWQAGTMTDLGTLGGSSSEANAINDSGQVGGGANTASGEWHAFFWQQDVMTDLGAEWNWYDNKGSYASVINGNGQVAGAGYIDNVPRVGRIQFAVLWFVADNNHLYMPAIRR
jgi:probable HAF family extracellular repeat protein